MVDLAMGRKAMGGSAVAQVFGQIGNEAPDIRDVQLLKDYFDAIEQLHDAGIVLAYHDISDGGIFTCLVEMAVGMCSPAHYFLFQPENGSEDMIRDPFNFRRISHGSKCYT